VQYEVAIAGAGPAGVSCAMALVRKEPSLRGRVALFDRARFPRSKPCGGGLTGHADEAMRALGLELTVESIASPRARVTFGSVDREVTLARPVRVVRREEFDASLVAQARDAGVIVHQETAVEGFTVDGRGVELGAGGQTVRARVLVGADGVGSAVRKRILGERTAEHDGPRAMPIRLFRAEIQARGRWLPDTMLYDFTAMRDGLRGYVWIFPVPGDRLNVGLMHYPGAVERSGAELTELLRKHLERFGVTLDAAARGWPAWGYSPSTRVAAERLILCGDSAGIDALTGEGIAVGMEQGLVAAEHIWCALASNDFSFSLYRRALRRATVGRELAIDRWLARLLYGGTGWRRWLPLVLCDDRMLDLYAARVCGSLVLADHKRELVRALMRHLARGRSRSAILNSA
jgi:geranylgeranyl reductase family protein